MGVLTTSRKSARALRIKKASGITALPSPTVFWLNGELPDLKDMFIKFVIHVIHVKKELITVRDVDETVLRNFRARAIQKKMKMGDAITDAMKKWIKEGDLEKTDSTILLKFKPFDWGPGAYKTSKEIDRILYGS